MATTLKSAKEKPAKEKEVKTVKPVKPAKAKNPNNPMREIFIEKIVLSCGGVDKELEKAKKLLEIITGVKAQVIASQKRIPDFGVRPGLEVGVRITLRGDSAIQLLRRLLSAEDNKIKSSQVSDNHFSFGIKEYIEIPGLEYQRDIGVRGLSITVVFARAGLRVKRKKAKAGTVPHRQFVKQEDIIKFMGENFKTKFE